MAEVAKIELDGKTHELPVVVGTEKEKAIDIDKLRALSGYVTLDSGFKNTGATKSAITFLDGENGVLHYRGYSIESLADNATFPEVAYLLLYGDLPNQTQLDDFNSRLKERSMPHEGVRRIIDAYPDNAHPMGVLASAIGSMSAFDTSALDPNRSAEMVDDTVVRLIAQTSTLTALLYKKQKGQPALQPSAKHGYTADFVRMMYGTPMADFEPDPVVVAALDKLLILHADHEQNCSASTVRIVGSSQANLYGAVSAGVNALWGPLHGGANQEVIEMLEQIQADGGNIDKWIAKAKDKEDPFRLMGFGHRVYKNFDPRARIIKKACDDILGKLGIQDPTLDIAKKLEEIALSDEYFVTRKLYPNVDFYSGIIYRALGIPTDMFTVMFALGRMPGWIAQWKEMIANKEPIGRPRQIYVGHTNREFKPVGQR